jgi:hypothetical protein
VPRLHRADLDRLVADDDRTAHAARPRPGRGRDRRPRSPADPSGPRPRPHARADGRESFKCGRCRAFIGPTVSGGRHRNHCPFCLTSRHVDLRRPGDRASPCRALMAPIGTFFRPKGEQVVLHRCNGCGLERHNRVAADDDPLALLRLPPTAPRTAQTEGADEAIA